MLELAPIVLERGGVRLEPLSNEHVKGLAEATVDGRLWELYFTATVEPELMHEYVAHALSGQAAGDMLPWAVRDLASGAVIGSTRYHDIRAEIDRVEVGYTWYAKRFQRTHVNTTCKLMLFEHAFETLGCRVVALQTDAFNFTSQRAIEALGAKKDGIIRHERKRRDGTIRDTVVYSILATEWPNVKRHLEHRLARHATK